MASAAEFVRLVAQGLVTPAFWALLLHAIFEYGLCYVTQRAWLARMTPERRAQAWNDLSWATAILHLGVLSMIPFAWVTRARRGAKAGALALVIGAGVAALHAGVVIAVGSLLGWLVEP